MTKPDFTPDAYSMKMEISRLKAQLAKANERVEELEGQLQLTMLTTHEASFESDYGQKRLSKFAIEKKIEAINAVLDLGKLYTIGEVDQWAIDDAKVERFIEQLRKEQE